MSIGDKIMGLRRRKGWSQEEFAEKLDVSRQAVSKWESGQSNPELEKIIMMSDMFGVSTDYLLKDSIDNDGADDIQAEVQSQARQGARTGCGNCDNACDNACDNTCVNACINVGISVRKVTAEDAEGYIRLRSSAARLIAIATVLCILPPIALIILAGVSDAGLISELLACSVGLGVLFLLVLIAVPIYIYCGFRKKPYEYLENMAEFELTDNAREYVSGESDARSREYMALNMAGACLCICSPVPLIISSFFDNDILMISMLGVLLAIVAVGVYMFIYAGVRHASFELLLKKGEPSPSEKISGVVMTVYWSLISAIYLLWSFLSGDWHITWLVFAVGGALCPAVCAICGRNSKDDR